MSHADGWALGHNFLFLDTLISEQGEPSQVNVYGELYSYFSLNKITGRDLSYGLFKDLNATVGVNLGENLDFWGMLSAVYWLLVMPLLCR